MGSPRTSITPGDTFGRWTVIARPEGRLRNGGWIFRCQCECGAVKNVRKEKLVNGTSRSCGCLRAEVALKHGLARKNRVAPELPVWNAMLRRCHNPRSRQYPDYGARGIKVCERWHTFSNFVADMGRRPTGGTIERIDNDGDYCPENCRWASRAEQARNKRNTRRITANGETLCLSEWAKRLGVSHATIILRIRAGWPEHIAVTAPKGSMLSKIAA